jgi:hypothetical protein
MHERLAAGERHVPGAADALFACLDGLTDASLLLALDA